MADLAVALEIKLHMWDLERDLERDFLAKTKELKLKEGAGFAYFLCFTPKFGEDEPILTMAYFSKAWEKKPPSSEGSWVCVTLFLFFGGISYYIYDLVFLDETKISRNHPSAP